MTSVPDFLDAMGANESGLDVLVDALIAAGSAFTGYLAIGGWVQDARLALASAAIAGGLAFFGSLAAARRRGSIAEA